MTVNVLICSATALVDGHLRNVGDEALADGLAHAFLTAGAGSVTLTTQGIRDDAATGLKHRRVESGSPRALVPAMREAGLVVVGGGTLLANNNQSSRWLTGLPRYVLAVAALAKAMRRPTALVGVGAQDWRPAAARLAMRRAVRMVDHVSVRDEASYRLLLAETGRAVCVAGDAYYGHPLPALSRPPRQPRESTVVALAGITEPDEQQRVVEMLRAAGPAAGQVVLRRMDQSGKDDAVAQRVAAGLEGGGQPVRLALLTRSWSEVAEELQAADLVIASRLHALIIASAAGRPSIAVGRNPKVIEFARAAGVPLLREVTTIADARPADEQVVQRWTRAVQSDVASVLALAQRS